jgi:hypothetical protein
LPLEQVSFHGRLLSGAYHVYVILHQPAVVIDVYRFGPLFAGFGHFWRGFFPFSRNFREIIFVGDRILNFVCRRSASSDVFVVLFQSCQTCSCETKNVNKECVQQQLFLPNFA